MARSWKQKDEEGDIHCIQSVSSLRTNIPAPLPQRLIPDRLRWMHPCPRGRPVPILTIVAFVYFENKIHVNNEKKANDHRVPRHFKFLYLSIKGVRIYNVAMILFYPHCMRQLSLCVMVPQELCHDSLVYVEQWATGRVYAHLRL